MKIFVINHGTYLFDVLVAIGSSQEEVCLHIKKNFKYNLDEEEKEKLYMAGTGRTVMLRNHATILRIDSTANIHSTIAHEVFHCVEFLFNAVGIKHSDDSSEAFAYQIEHLTRQIYKNLKIK